MSLLENPVDERVEIHITDSNSLQNDYESLLNGFGRELVDFTLLAGTERRKFSAHRYDSPL
jgi:hypothetical protein